ncbi:MAG: hypothetical protein JWN64_50 [Parcubacteria group bacterium]|nr:hypothetical protein [Parcubacteria group bacterium]
MDLRRSSASCAYALLRRLYQLYDAGGHSGRSIRSQLIEGIIFQVKHDMLPKIGPELETLERIQRKVGKERKKRGPLQRNFPFGLAHLSQREYACVALAAHNLAWRLEVDVRSHYEKHFILLAAILLGLDENYRYYKALAVEHSVDEILREGKRRWLQTRPEDNWDQL